MSVAGVVSYFSRFTVKLVEIVAASIATAVGGYLVAHLGGYLPWSASPPVPAAIQTAPNVSVVPKGPRAQPAPPIATGADEHRPASHQDAGPPPIQPARATAKATSTVPPRKPMTTGTNAAETKPMTTGTSTAESKPDDMKSVETEVRAALEKVDAQRPAASDAAPQTVSLPPAPPAAAAEPQPTESPVLGTAGAVAVPPPAAAAVVVTPPAAEAAREPVQQAPVQPEPLTPVEIKSRPVADVAALPPPEPAAPAQENVQADAKADDKGLLSTLKKIPEMLRSASGATSNDPPRPPLPVGQ